MSAPDHRPYAAPTDLVTAEDVSEWLDTLHRGPPAERIFGVQDAVAALDARLDRERRQACRRGALTAWRFACGQRAIERDWRKATPDEFQSREDLDEWAALAHEDRVTEVRRALAFRAAARAK